MENYSQDLLESQELQIDYESNRALEESAKWGKFISIVLFVFAGILLIVGLLAVFLAASTLSALPVFGSISGLGTELLIGIILFVVALVVVTYYFLFIFSTKIKTAIATDNASNMNTAIGSLKTFFAISAVISGISLLFSIYSLFK